MLFLAIPLFALSWRAIAHLDDLQQAGRVTVVDALVLSATTSLTSLLVIIGLGTPLAFLIARRSFRGKTVLETLIDMPMVMPPAVAGLALLMAFGRRGVLGSWLDDAGIRIGFTTTAVIFAQIFVSSPFYVRSGRAAFSRVDRNMEDAAADLGASPWRVLRSVTLPLAAPGLIAGAVLAWARAVGEFGATIMFAGNLPRETQTLPLAIYGRYEAGDLETSLAMALILLVSSFLVLVSVRGLGGRLRLSAAD
ncbi:MAG TPA: ABC transporter permease [Thermomicrobiales bacterium]|nr:ABC transporter permease [Thermomicrobiales bacterium]